MGLAITRHVFAIRQRHVAVPAREVLKMPELAFGLGVFNGEDELVAGGTSRQSGFGVMTAAIQFLIFVEVDEINE